MAAPSTGAGPATVQEFLYKVLVVGEFGVGKTSIIKRYTEGTYTPNYKLTIGVDFALKTLEWNDQVRINLQLWDIAGHERFGSMTRVYYKYAVAAVIVFDLSRPATFDNVLKWLNDVHAKVTLATEEPVPVILLANKCDLDSVPVDTQRLNQFCQEHDILAWFPTSAKHDINIDDAIQFLVGRVMSLSDKYENVDDWKLDSVDGIQLKERIHSTKKCCVD